MAIFQEQVQEVQGFDKQIEASALGSILDNLQMYQYNFPQKSTIREVVSNGLDSIKEKLVAIAILTGKEKVEDHYIIRDDPMFKDSNFNPEYYDLKWLSPNKTVTVEYFDGGNLDKDRVVITDYGVGLGGKRLEGYFRLGYSTKRNSKYPLGKFGIGAKSPLSTAPFYTVISRYNGCEFRFNVYSHKVQSIVPAFTMGVDPAVPDSQILGTELPYVIFGEGENKFKVHYYPTKEKNGVSVEIASKKFHKSLYIQAVKSQLMYFDDVKFVIHHNDGQGNAHDENVPVKAEILYENPKIILSNNDQYSKPHLLINRVNYGNINFQELELEDQVGNIGIKVAAEDVTISPSRESVIWNELTRETIVRRFREVVEATTELISEELKVPNFLDWIVACAQISSHYASSNQNNVLSRLAKIVDISKLNPKFVGDERIRYAPGMFIGSHFRKVTMATETKRNSRTKKIVRNNLFPGDMAAGLPIYIQTTGSSNKKDRYLLDKLHPGGFISIRVPEYVVTGDDPDEEQESWTKIQEEEIKHARFDLEKHKESIRRLWHQFALCKHTPYSAVIVPDGYSDEEEVEEGTTQVSAEVQQIAADARRKAQGRIVMFSLRTNNYSNEYSFTRYGWTAPAGGPGGAPNKMFTWQKEEPLIAEIDAWNNEEIYWGNEADIPLLHMAGMLTRPTPNAHDNIFQGEGYTNSFKDESDIRLFKVSQDNVKYVQDHENIKYFFQKLQGKTITMSNKLVLWNTARYIKERIQQVQFLRNFQSIDNARCLEFKQLQEYMFKHFKEMEELTDKNVYAVSKASYKDLVDHCNKLANFQRFVRENAGDDGAIGRFSQELFNPTKEANAAEIDNALALDLAIVDRIDALLEFAEPIKDMLNAMPILTGKLMFAANREEEGFVKDREARTFSVLSPELEQQVVEYMKFKNVLS